MGVWCEAVLGRRTKWGEKRGAGALPTFSNCGWADRVDLAPGRARCRLQPRVHARHGKQRRGPAEPAVRCAAACGRVADDAESGRGCSRSCRRPRKQRVRARSPHARTRHSRKNSPKGQSSRSLSCHEQHDVFDV
eukprot:364181-Chlamydomonas_euryale.AAC.4